MAEIYYFDCLKYSYKLVETTCNCLLLVGSRKAVTARRRILIKAGMNPASLIVVKTSREQKEEYRKSKNSSIFMTLENWK
ncbi:MAG: hypothetical protein ACOY4I_12735 [Bacillota bacterium]